MNILWDAQITAKLEGTFERRKLELEVVQIYFNLYTDSGLPLLPHTGKT